MSRQQFRPGTIPGQPPIGLRYNDYFQFTSGGRNNFNNLLPPGTLGPYVPTTDFETGLFSIFTAGNFGSDIAFWVDDDISVSGANGNGGLGEAYLKFVNVSRFLKLPEYAVNLRVGQMELDFPFTAELNALAGPGERVGEPEECKDCQRSRPVPRCSPSSSRLTSRMWPGINSDQDNQSRMQLTQPMASRWR